MRFGLRRGAWLALGLVVLCPALARADALDGAFMALQLWVAVWGLALLLMLFSVLAFRRPASPTLRVLNLVGVGISLLLGAAGLFIAGKMGTSGGLGSFNPFLSLALPLAAWLGGVSHAASATQPRARQWAVTVAGTGARLTLSTLLNLGLRALLPDSLNLELASHPYVNWALGLLMLVGAWQLVLRSAQRQQPLAWQLPTIVQVAALSTVLGTLYSYLPVLLYMDGIDTVWFSQAFKAFFTYGLFSFALSALIIWRQQRRYRP
jgi:hypothetical protein